MGRCTRRPWGDDEGDDYKWDEDVSQDEDERLTALMRARVYAKEQAQRGGYTVPPAPENLVAPPVQCDTLLYANVYLIDREYGGPEEGGWYYDTGEPLASVPIPAKTTDEGDVVPVDRDATTRIVEKLKQMFACQGASRSRYSVIGGPDVEVYIEDRMAQRFPQHRPHYE